MFLLTCSLSLEAEYGAGLAFADPVDRPDKGEVAGPAAQPAQPERVGRGHHAQLPPVLGGCSKLSLSLPST